MKTSPACLDPRFQRLKPAVQLADLGACLHQPLLDQRYHSLKKSNRKVCATKKVINILLQRQDPPPGDTGLGCERRRRFYSYSTILQRDPGRLRLNQGASLQPEENKVCSPVSGDRIIQLWRSGSMVPSGEPLIRVRGMSSPCRLLPRRVCVGK